MTPREKKGVTSVSVRLDATTLARLDALAAAVSLVPGKRKRATAIEAAILMGLDAFEAERATPEKKEGGPR